MRLRRAFCLLACAAGARLLADNNPAPSQSPYSVSPPYEGAGINQPFPDSIYGADHGGSSMTLSNPYLSPFGNADHSRGVITYNVAPFTPRNSEGVYGMDVWLEQQDASGNWNVAALNGGVADQGSVYQPVNTPNPGPSPGYAFTWTFYATQLPPNTNFRVFVYVYLYNQGGGSQGNFYVASAIGPINTGAANDAPRISWTASSGVINPAQAIAGQTYTISADAQDDNGNLTAVSINKNGAPFAYAGGGNGYSGSSQNPSSDPPGAVTYTAWATDALGAQSPTITWTVTNVGRFNQAPVSSSNATLQYYTQPFTPNYYGGSGSGSWQFCVAYYTSWTVAADSNAGTELSPSNAWSPSWMPPAPGTYYFWVAKDGDGSYYPSGAAGLYTLTVSPSPPVGSFDGLASTSVAQGQALSGSGWAADPQMGAPVSSVQILIDNGANGTFPATLGGYRPDVQAINLGAGHWSPLDITNCGWSFSYSTTSLGIGAHTVTAIAYDGYGLSDVLPPRTFTVSPPQYTVSTFAVGNGSVTPGGVYPQNTSLTLAASPGAGAWFTGWTGSLSGSSNPLAVTVNGNLSLYANFSPLQAQTIIFSPPPTVTLPGSPLALTATASSGLPVSFTVVSGPATLAGDQLTITGPGSVIVQAVQTGNGEWLAAAPISEVITAAAPAPILRIRFNPSGSDARITRPATQSGASMISTDPAGLQTSPWPSFANPQPALPLTGGFPLPTVPAAPILQH